MVDHEHRAIGLLCDPSEHSHNSPHLGVAVLVCVMHLKQRVYHHNANAGKNKQGLGNFFQVAGSQQAFLKIAQSHWLIIRKTIENHLVDWILRRRMTYFFFYIQEHIRSWSNQDDRECT